MNCQQRTTNNDLNWARIAKITRYLSTYYRLSHEDCEDITQNAAVIVWRTGRPICLFAIVRRLMQSMLRSKARRGMLSQESFCDVPEPFYEERKDMLDAPQDIQDLYEALQTLTPAELATELGVHPSTVHAQIRRLRKWLTE